VYPPDEWPTAATRVPSTRGPNVGSARSRSRTMLRSRGRRQTANVAAVSPPAPSPGWSTAATSQPARASGSASQARFARPPPLPCERRTSGSGAPGRSAASRAPVPRKMPFHVRARSRAPSAAGYQTPVVSRRSRAGSSSRRVATPTAGGVAVPTSRARDAHAAQPTTTATATAAARLSGPPRRALRRRSRAPPLRSAAGARVRGSSRRRSCTRPPFPTGAPRTSRSPRPP